MNEAFKHRLTRAMVEGCNVGAESDSSVEQGSHHEHTHDVTTLRRMAHERAWRHIDALQVEKRAFVNELNEWRKQFWHHDRKQTESRDTSLSLLEAQNTSPRAKTLYASADGSTDGSSFELRRNTKEGGVVRVPISRGEVLTAHVWGTWWRLDESLTREDQISIMGHQVRAHIQTAYDAQLITFGAHDRLSDDRKRDTYERINTYHDNLDKMPDGILAERMLVSFLTKAMYDSNCSFTVEEADSYDDVEHKIDFVISVRDHRRGVQVGEPVQRIGIQFTLNQAVTARKQTQIERAKKHIGETEVDDIMLITMPLENIRSMYEKWRYKSDGTRREAKQLDPRGPDHLWSEEVRQHILREVVHSLNAETTPEKK
jgi:hypothetical protein